MYSGTKKNLYEVIDNFKKVHGDKYDYSLVEYQGYNIHIDIICPEHGVFRQRPKYHIGGRGCRKCSAAKVAVSRKSSKMTQKEFVGRSSERHLGKYDYSKSVYTGFNNKVVIICPKHGEFLQSPKNHLNSRGCYTCGRKSTGDKSRSRISREEFIQKSSSVQVEEYDYSCIPSTIEGVTSKVQIICKEHGKFSQTVQAHMKGHGCALCCYRGYSKNSYVEHCNKYGYKEAIFYVIKIMGVSEVFYKVGITAISVKHRFRKLKAQSGYSYSPILELRLPPGDCWDKESYIKRKLRKFKYTPKIIFAGSTECFVDNPIKLLE